jgi:hypothetical protein
MKRTGHIYEKICDLENIRLTIMKSSLGKRTQYRVERILNNIDHFARQVQTLLINKNYIPSPYIIKTVQDGSSGKIRNISKPRYYPDQIVHWALILQIQPLIMKGMYEYNCGSIPGRGTGYGQKILRKWLNKDYKGTKYCLKMDISKFYSSVNNEILKAMFHKRIKDKDCLWLIDTIVDSSQGLPIGNYTSQWFSNFFLQGLDHHIKEKLGAKYYVRYVDDLVILGPNKKKLHKMRSEIATYLEEMDLKLKQNWQVFKVNSRAIDFLGFRFFRNKTILRKRNALRIKRRIGKIKKKGFLNYKDACAIVSYWGWMKRSDSYYFYHKYVKPVMNIEFAKKVVSDVAKIRNYTGRGVDIKRKLPGRLQTSDVCRNT